VKKPRQGVLESPWTESLIDIPYLGIDYPIIDGEGVSSMGWEGVGIKRPLYIKDRMNEYEPLNPPIYVGKIKEE